MASEITQSDLYNMNSNSSSGYTDKYSKLLTGNNYIYIYHLPNSKNDGGTYLYIPVWPDEISDTIATSFQQESALARSAPTMVFSNSGPRTVQFKLQLHRDMMDEANMEVVGNLGLDFDMDSDEDYVDYLIKCLMSIALPNYHSGNKEVEPPMVAVRFGNDVFVKGVVTSGIGVEYSKPILTNDKYAVANISFTVVEIDPMDAVSVSKVGSFRNISKTFKNFTV